MTASEFARSAGVSRETLRTLQRLHDHVARWNLARNLVAAATLDDIWRRHFLDSAQLLPIIAKYRDQTGRRSRDSGWVVDLGSGAGFPGLVLSIMGIGGIHLVESNAKKVTFLKYAVRDLELDAVIHNCRIEDYVRGGRPGVGIVVARAVAPLRRLLELSEPLLATGAIGIFPKGRDWAAELSAAETEWALNAKEWPSISDPMARIVVVDKLNKLSQIKALDTFSG